MKPVLLWQVFHDGDSVLLFFRDVGFYGDFSSKKLTPGFPHKTLFRPNAMRFIQALFVVVPTEGSFLCCS